jgi:hypothetical protein
VLDTDRRGKVLELAAGEGVATDFFRPPSQRASARIACKAPRLLRTSTACVTRESRTAGSVGGSRREDSCTSQAMVTTYAPVWADGVMQRRGKVVDPGDEWEARQGDRMRQRQQPVQPPAEVLEVERRRPLATPAYAFG